jgi:hypothetical protein
MGHRFFYAVFPGFNPQSRSRLTAPRRVFDSWHRAFEPAVGLVALRPGITIFWRTSKATAKARALTYLDARNRGSLTSKRA